MWPLRLALPFPPARKTNGGRLRPAGCPPPSPARLSLPFRSARCTFRLPDRKTNGRLARPGARLAVSCCPTAPLALVAAPPVPLGPLHLPDRKTNGRRPRPAGCLAAFSRSFAPLLLPCPSHPASVTAPWPAPSRQIDKRQAPAPRGVPCRLLLPAPCRRAPPKRGSRPHPNLPSTRTQIRSEAIELASPVS